MRHYVEPLEAWVGTESSATVLAAHVTWFGLGHRRLWRLSVASAVTRDSVDFRVGFTFLVKDFSPNKPDKVYGVWVGLLLFAIGLEWWAYMEDNQL